MYLLQDVLNVPLASRLEILLQALLPLGTTGTTTTAAVLRGVVVVVVRQLVTLGLAGWR